LEQDVRNYYETYFDLFTHTGWEQFQADVKAASETIQILALQDAKELHLAQGQLQVFNRLLNWEDAIANSYESILSEEDAGVNNG
jgi:hypothetical protein